MPYSAGNTQVIKSAPATPIASKVDEISCLLLGNAFSFWMLCVVHNVIPKKCLIKR